MGLKHYINIMLSSNSECGRFLNGIVSLGEIASCFRECTDKKESSKKTEDKRSDSITNTDDH